MGWNALLSHYRVHAYGRHNQYKEINPNRLTQLIMMSKIPSMVLPLYLVSRLSPVPDSNKSNLDAVGRVVASGQPGMHPKRLILKRKRKRGYIRGSGNL